MLLCLGTRLLEYLYLARSPTHMPSSTKHLCPTATLVRRPTVQTLNCEEIVVNVEQRPTDPKTAANMSE